jgi:hypothetical protein
MKTTSKEYQAMCDLRRKANHQIQRIKEGIEPSYIEVLELEQKVKELEQTYFDQVEKVFVEFYIGFRRYYRQVVKIGKTYFDRADKLTKSNGYRWVKEIPEITEKMTEEMIADSYYY